MSVIGFQMTPKCLIVNDLDMLFYALKWIDSRQPVTSALLILQKNHLQLYRTDNNDSIHKVVQLHKSSCVD